MKRHLIYTALCISTFLISCQNEQKKQSKTDTAELLQPNIDIKNLESNFRQWWTYQSNNISLSSNFEGLNADTQSIHKEDFLKTLTSGDFIPLKLKSTDSIHRYKLYKLDDSADESIRSTIKSTALFTLEHYKMEGSIFPEFDLTDLNGNQYTNETTKGKITVFKTWFINCKACVAEFPELNEFVENHEDIVFISLALDTKPELETFLKMNHFKYPVIPEQKELIKNELKLQIYPTHIVVDENGIILKVVNKASEMITFLDNTKKATSNIPPPPPPM